ncbi:MAG: methyl-accepting chemotaxis protein [Nannocystaceae bacterium]
MVARPLAAAATGLGAGSQRRPRRGRHADRHDRGLPGRARLLRELLAVSAKRKEALHSRETEVWSSRSSGIGDFLDDVARRLQLLALNGNIIAAQAGEHGRAFRVVCRELSTLAERSRTKVTDVRKVLQGMASDEEHGEPSDAGVGE